VKPSINLTREGYNAVGGLNFGGSVGFVEAPSPAAAAAASSSALMRSRSY